MRTRRMFLGLMGGTVLSAAFPVTAFANSDGSYDISYLWAPGLDAVLDYREIVAEILGDEVARGLIVVRGGTGNWGLLLDRTETNEAAAKRLAAEHHHTLRRALGSGETLATVLPDRGFDRTYHVRYGVYDTSERARQIYAAVARELGRRVEATLYVEQVSAQRWHVVYKRFGTHKRGLEVAAAHGRVLRSRGLRPTVVSDHYCDERWAIHSVDGSESRATTEPIIGPGSVEPSTVTKRVTRTPPPAKAPSRPTLNDRAPVRDELPAKIRTPLRDAINRHIQELRRDRLIERDETTSWYVQTLHDNRTWAAINGELKLQCASMVKPFVALAFLHRAKQGRLIYGDVSRRKLESMIHHSNNPATNWAMEKVGGPRGVQRILTQAYGHIFRETSITEYIPSNGRTYRNRSSARDYIRFSRALWNDELPHSAEIRRLMGLPGRDRLATGAPAIPASTKVMNKTGTTSRLCGDFGILVARSAQGADVPYAFAGIIEKRNRARSFTGWTSQRSHVIRSVSNLVYEELDKYYRLG